MLAAATPSSRPSMRLQLTRRAAVMGGVFCGQGVLVTRIGHAAVAEPVPLCDEDVSVLTSGNKQIVLVGTAHVSEESSRLVRRVIRSVQPDLVMVELDRRRAATLLYKDKVRRGGEQTADGVSSSAAQQSRGAAFYQSLEAKGFPAGGEFLAAIEEARLLNATVLLGDQDIDITLQRLREARLEVRQLRAEGVLSREDAKAALRGLPRSLLQRSEALTADDVTQMTDDLRRRDNARAVAAYLKQAAPPVYEAMIGERDAYMANALEVAPGTRVVAVVGLAHLEGMERILGDQVLAAPDTAVARECEFELESRSRAATPHVSSNSPSSS